jgi:hypothetical protein
MVCKHQGNAMMPKTRRGLLIVLAGLVTFVVVAVFVAPGLYARWFGRGVVTNVLVGQTETQIRGVYGTPAEDWPGYERLALKGPHNLPPGHIRTLVFHPRGRFHLEGGTLWVWLHQQGDAWVCFESCWFADGVNF